MSSFRRWLAIGVLIFVLPALPAYGSDASAVRVASKNFTESYLLAEIVAQLLQAHAIPVQRRFGLGGTLICFEALVNDEIDVYVEYSGTLSQAILGLPMSTSIDKLQGILEGRGLQMLPPLGFNNTYAVAMRRATAARLGIASIGDLERHRQLRVMLSHEFLEREDGWPGLAAAYGLSLKAGGIEHGLAYQALNDGTIDVTDAYSTDGEIQRYDLVLLHDDRSYFPSYLALPLARRDLPDRAATVLAALKGVLSDARMQALNAEATLQKRSFAEVAAGFLASSGLVTTAQTTDTRWADLARNTLVHLELTGTAMAAAVVLGISASLVVFRMPTVSRVVMYVSGLLQTIPSIALLALMIPLLGIGPAPAIVALFLYSLLPIVRNTVTALRTLDPTLQKVAVAIGLSPAQQLRWVHIPLALPSMLAGIRTAAVISIGTATLAAFIGAGGLGDPIVTGLALNDVGLILQGAVPAAGLAVLTELAFELVERLVLPGHLRPAA